MGEEVLVVLGWVFGAVLLGMAIALAVIVALSLWARKRPRRMAAAGPFPPERVSLLKGAARTFGGAVVDDPEHYRFPFFRGQADGALFAVALAPADGETRDPAAAYVVRFEAPIAGRRFVEAWPEGSPYPPLRLSSAAPDLKVGDPEFDRAHVVRADDPAHARAILTPELRALLGRLRGVGNGGRVRFDLFPYKLLVQKEEMLADGGSLEAFTRHALGTLAEVRSGLEAQAGVEFYEDAPKRPEQALCPICGAGVSAARAICVRCHTPHHVDCWKYFGRCSMFACGEGRYSL